MQCAQLSSVQFARYAGVHFIQGAVCPVCSVLRVHFIYSAVCPVCSVQKSVKLRPLQVLEVGPGKSATAKFDSDFIHAIFVDVNIKVS